MKQASQKVGIWFTKGFLVILLFLLPSSIIMSFGLSGESFNRLQDSVIFFDTLQQQVKATIESSKQYTNGSSTESNPFDVFSGSTGTQAVDSSKPKCSQDEVSKLIASESSISPKNCELGVYDQALISRTREVVDNQSSQSSQIPISSLSFNNQYQLSGLGLMTLKILDILRIGIFIVIILLVMTIGVLFAIIRNITEYLQALAKPLAKVGIFLTIYGAVTYVLINMHLLSLLIPSTQLTSIEQTMSPYTLLNSQINVVVGVIYIIISFGCYRLARKLLQYQKLGNVLGDPDVTLMYNKDHD